VHVFVAVFVNKLCRNKTLQLCRKLLKRKRNDSTEPSALVWCDRSPVYFISSIHDPRKSTTVSRRYKDGSVCVVFCPQLVADYTIYMGGCDNNDQMTKLYRARRHYRWPNDLCWSAYFGVCITHSLLRCLWSNTSMLATGVAHFMTSSMMSHCRWLAIIEHRHQSAKACQEPKMMRTDWLTLVDIIPSIYLMPRQTTLVQSVERREMRINDHIQMFRRNRYRTS